jgi:hypothetical membrane protein
MDDRAGTAATGERIAGGLLFLLAALFMTVIMLAASIAPDYDYSGSAISDLGTIAATATLFNVTLIVVGTLNAAAGWVLYRGRGRIGVLALFAIAGAGAIGAGLIPLGTSGLHSVFALLAFACFNLEAIVSSALVRGPMRWISILAGVVGFVFVVLMVIGDGGNAAAFGSIGHGGTERMIVYPVMLWMLAFGGYLMRGVDAN